MPTITKGKIKDKTKSKKKGTKNQKQNMKKAVINKRRKIKVGGDFSTYNSCSLPVLASTDSYKLSHQLMYPNRNHGSSYSVKKMIAYGECRGPLKIEGKPITYYDYEKTQETVELRLVNFGLLYIIENYINKRITGETIENIKEFYKTHGFLNSPYPADYELLNKLIGKFPPIKIYGLSEGTVILPRTPVYVIEAHGEFAPFVTYYETILTMIWYPISVASLSKCCKDFFKRKYDEIASPKNHYNFIDFSLHDFGFRGASSVETSTIGGMAHLLNFRGTDTLSAAYYAQYKYNDGYPVGESIAASEHSVMTSYKYEFDAFYQILKKFAGGQETDVDKKQYRDKDTKIPKPPFAIVMDSYNYEKALVNVFAPAVKKFIDIDRKTKEDFQHYVNSFDFENNIFSKIYIDDRDGKQIKFSSYNDLLKITMLDDSIFKSDAIFTMNEIKKLPRGFAFTFRPDSGNPYVAVIQSLIAGLKMFGIDEEGSFYGNYTFEGNDGKKYIKNNILYIKPKFVRTIQGDGINVFTIKGMLDAITDPFLVSSNGLWAFSPYSLLCGMGGGLLQKVNRDTVNFATKLSYVEYDDGSNKIVMKSPETDSNKRSLPGKLCVRINENGLLVTDIHPDHKIEGLENKIATLKDKKNRRQQIDTNHNPPSNIYDRSRIWKERREAANKANAENLKKENELRYRLASKVKQGGDHDDNNGIFITYFDGTVINNQQQEPCLKFNKGEKYFEKLRKMVEDNWEKLKKYKDIEDYPMSIEEQLTFDARTKELKSFQEYIDLDIKYGDESKQAQNIEDIYSVKDHNNENLYCISRSPFVEHVKNNTKNDSKFTPEDYKKTNEYISKITSILTKPKSSTNIQGGRYGTKTNSKTYHKKPKNKLNP
jgi:nicotinic acid phosphoribosyltransferase